VPASARDRTSRLSPACRSGRHAPLRRIPLADFPAVAAWCERVAAQDGYVNDLAPYPANAQAGAGRSIYG
jgi:hypothetical protein